MSFFYSSGSSESGGNTTVDRRVVQISFDNKNFESNVRDSLNTLEQLNKSLQFNNGSAGLQVLSSGIQEVHNQFSALDVIAGTALATITRGALRAGASLVRSIVNPITQGGLQRALNFEQAKFKFTGLGLTDKQIGDATKKTTAMGRAYEGVRGTLYSLDKAANVSAQLMASGIDPMSAKMTKHLRAIAGVASMTNTDFAQMGDIFTTAASNGKIMTEQLRQLSYHGLNASASLAKYLNVSEAEVNEMVSKGQVSFQQFSDAMYEAFGDAAGRSKEIFTGALADMKAAAGRIGEKIYTPLLQSGRDFFNATVPLLDSINNRITPYINSAAGAFGKLVSKVVVGIDILSAAFDFKETKSQLEALVEAGLATEDRVKNLTKYSGAIKTLSDVINGLGNVFKFTIGIVKDFFSALGSFLKIGEGLGPVFANIGTSFKELTEKLPKSSHALSDWASNLSEVIKNNDRFIAFKKGIADAIGSIPKLVTNANDCLLDMVDTLGQIIDKVTTGAFNQVHKFFSMIGGVADLKDIISMGILAQIATGIMKIKRAAEGEFSIGGFLKGLGLDTIDAFRKISESFTNALDRLGEALSIYQKTLKANILLKIAAAIGILALSLKIMSSVPVEVLFGEALVLGLLGRILLTFTHEMVDVCKMLSSMKTGFSLAMLTVFLIGFASAVAAMASVAVKISKIPFEKFGQGLLGVALITIMLVYVAKEMNKIGEMKILDETALLIFAASVYILGRTLERLSKLDWDGIKRGLVALAGVVGTFAVVIWALSKVKGMERIGGTMLAVSIAISILARAMKQLSTLDEAGLNVAILALLALEVVLTTTVAIVSMVDGKTLGIKVLALLGVALAIKMLVGAFQDLSGMSTDGFEVAFTSLTMIATILTVMLGITSALKNAGALAVKAMALIGVAIALKLVVGSFITLGAMDEGGIGRASLALAGIMTMLLVFFGGMAAIGGPGAMIAASAAILIFAAAVAVIAFALTAMSGISPDSLMVSVMAILTLVSVFALLSTLFVTSIPAMLAMSFTLLTFGAAIAVLGIGLTLFSSGLSTFVDVVMSIGQAIFSSGNAFNYFIAGITAVLAIIVIATLPVSAFSLALLMLGLALTFVGLGLTAIGIGIGAIATGIGKVIGVINKFVKGVTGRFESMAKAMKRSTKEVSSAVGNIGKTLPKTYRQIKKELKKISNLKGDAKKAGKAVVDGLIAGLNSNRSRAIAAANELAEATLRAYKSKLRIKSPSRVMKQQGAYTVQGLAIGIKDNIHLVSEAMDMAAESVKDFTGSIDDNPVIRPVVDTRDLEAASQMMDTMLAREAAARIATSIDRSPSKMDLLSERLNASMKDLMLSSNESQNGGNSSVEIVVPLTVDGREFARATATYTQEEINKNTTRSNRLVGIL